MNNSYPPSLTSRLRHGLGALVLLAGIGGVAHAQTRAQSQFPLPQAAAARTQPLAGKVTTYTPLGTSAQVRQPQQAVAAAAATTTVTFANTQQGWFSLQDGHLSYNVNYLVGKNETGGSYRDFFTFSLANLDLTGKQVVSASLSLVDAGYSSIPNSTVTYALYDVSTPAATLAATYAGTSSVVASVYSDLGTGQSYGSFANTTSVTGGRRVYTLTAAALTDIAARAGQDFTIGGILLEEQAAAQNYLFGYTGVGNSTIGNQILTLELADAQSITTGTVSSPVCAGSAVNVPFTAAGTFTTGNVFSAQLSDAAGSFAAPTTIGTLAGTSSGTIAATIPAATAAGSGYRVRVVSSAPAVTGTDNGSAITVNTAPVVTVPANQTVTNAPATGASVAFAATATGSPAPSIVYTLNGTPITSPYTFPVGTSTVLATATNSCGSNAKTFTVTITTPPASVSVQYQTGDFGQPTDGQLRPFLQLVNSGTAAVPYSQLTVRYWLTPENFMGQLVTPIDYAKLGTGFVSARYVQLATPRQGALGYIEYSFATGAGSLNANSDSGPIYGKAYKPDYSNLDETDDWSYQTSSSFTENSHVTLYQNGTLIGGTEPPAVTTTTSVNVFSASRDASASTSYLSVQLQVRNTGNRPVNYSDLTVRYYFTRDGATTIVPQVDYAKLGSGNVSVRYVPLATPLNGADGYLEIGFSAALGVFYPRTGTDDILFKIRKGDYTAFTQTNDYSFTSSTSLLVNNRFPAYLNGSLVFGTPPASASAAVAATPEMSARPSAIEAPAAATPSGAPELALTASPNPITDQVRLSFALPTAQAYTLAVYDGQGRLVQQLVSNETQAGQTQELEVPTQTYAAGLYLVRLTTAQGIQTLKLVKH